MRAGRERFAGARDDAHGFQDVGPFLQIEAPEAVTSAMDDLFGLQSQHRSASEQSTLQNQR